MKFIAEINVMPLKALLDPQGKAVTSVIHNIGFPEMNHVRIGKHITMEVEADNEEDATVKVEEVCKKALHNPIMEGCEFTLHKA